MEDMSNLVDEFSKIIQKNDIPDNLKEIINNLNLNTKKENTSTDDDNISSFDFNNIDIQTFLKLKSALDKINSKDNPNTKLLLALKPYLKSSKKQKLDQYIKLMNISNVLDILNKNEGDNTK